MRRYYLAESLKNRHTYIGILIILMPLLNVCLAAGLTADYFTIDSYNWWYIALFPGMLALIGIRRWEIGQSGFFRRIWDRYGTGKCCTESGVWEFPCQCFLPPFSVSVPALNRYCRRRLSSRCRLAGIFWRLGSCL